MRMRLERLTTVAMRSRPTGGGRGAGGEKLPFTIAAIRANMLSHIPFAQICIRANIQAKPPVSAVNRLVE